MANSNAPSPTKSAGTPTGEFRDPLLQINFDDPLKKKDKDYGRTILARIYKEQNNQSTTFYYGGRNIRWMEVTQWAYGRQEMKEFVDYVSKNGNKAFVNVDMTPNRTGAQFVETLVSFLSGNNEYACVTAIDDKSVQAKEKAKQDALFRMHEVDTISKLQQASGAHLEPPNAYVPDDEISANVYFELEHKIPIEIDFERRLERIQEYNQYQMNKRRIYRDFVVVNCACTKVEKLENGYISIRKCIPANMIYNFFLSDSGKMELSYIGEIYSLKIVDLRNKYGKTAQNPSGLTEQEVFEIAKYADQYNNSNRFYYYWNDSYLYATDRPYDDYSVSVFDCEIRSFDADYYVNKTDNYGKENIKPKNGIPKPTSDKSTVIKKSKLRWQRGLWAVRADKMIYWGDPDVKIIPSQDISTALSSYTINIPNNDGDYVPSLFERALEPLREYTLAKLQRKKILATIVPPGYTIDVEGIRDIDLGLGKAYDPEEVVNIYTNTGRLWWSSRGVNPNEKQSPPITGLPNAEGIAQLNELTQVMVTCKNEIRELLGVSIYMDGSYVQPRTGVGTVENQAQNTTNVIGFIPSAFKQIWEETLYKCTILEWDNAVLGKESRTDLLDTNFKITLEVQQTQEEKQELQVQLDTAMRSNPPLLSFKDAFFIKQIKNNKLANWYLSSMVEKNKREAQQQQQANVEQTAQAQQQSNAQTAANQKQLQDDKLQQEKEMAEYKALQEMKVAIVEGSFAVAAKGMDAQFPQWLAPILTQLVPNLVVPIQQENKQMAQSLAMDAQAEEMQQQQAAQQPQQGQPPQQGMPPQGQPQQQPQMQ